MGRLSIMNDQPRRYLQPSLTNSSTGSETESESGRKLLFPGQNATYQFDDPKHGQVCCSCIHTDGNTVCNLTIIVVRFFSGIRLKSWKQGVGSKISNRHGNNARGLYLGGVVAHLSLAQLITFVVLQTGQPTERHVGFRGRDFGLWRLSIFFFIDQEKVIDRGYRRSKRDDQQKCKKLIVIAAIVGRIVWRCMVQRAAHTGNTTRGFSRKDPSVPADPAFSLAVSLDEKKGKNTP
ncbi:hypothetical protein BGZ63DRAFT_462809 [Mariannaea sp. PMI_226]|nr:hypothetical protein BGZ63DRAFT_462809 [Mariannaea sp. PMI_226]